MSEKNPKHPNSFERYYLENVALSEGCGCAEQLLRRAPTPHSGDSLRDILSAVKERFNKSKDRRGERKRPVPNL